METARPGRGAHGSGEPVVFRHEALLYRDRAEYLAGVTGFLRGALDRGEPAMAAVPGERIGGLAQALGPAAGRMEFVNMAGVGRNPAAIIPFIRAFIDRHPDGRVSYLGEPAWPGRTGAELVETARHEALINLAFGGLPASILCPYDVAGLPAATIADAWRTHPAVAEGTASRRSGAYLPGLPPRCEIPLGKPPPGADELAYRTDLRPVRALVAARAAGAGLSGARAGDLVLAVSEVAANTLRHTPGGGKLSVWQEPGEIVCEIRDGGWITDPLAGRQRPPGQLSGQQGLWVVNKVCDLVEMRSGSSGTTLRLHMSVTRQNAPPGAAAEAQPASR